MGNPIKRYCRVDVHLPTGDHAMVSVFEDGKRIDFTRHWKWEGTEWTDVYSKDLGYAYARANGCELAHLRIERMGPYRSTMADSPT